MKRDRLKLFYNIGKGTINHSLFLMISNEDDNIGGK